MYLEILLQGCETRVCLGAGQDRHKKPYLEDLDLILLKDLAVYLRVLQLIFKRSM
jgi:hypothetical protein